MGMSNDIYKTNDDDDLEEPSDLSPAPEEEHEERVEDHAPLLNARSIYFKDLSKVIVLTPEKEREIYNKYRESGFKDEESRQRLLLGCLRLVVTRASRFCRKNPAMLDDLIGAGNEGLLVALTKYNPDKGTRIPSYAIYWIDLFIRTALSGNHPVKVPMWRQKKASKLRRLRGEGKTTEEMAIECGLTEEQLHSIEDSVYQTADIAALNAHQNLEYSMGIEGIDLYKPIDVEHDSIGKNAAITLHEVIAELPEEEQVIIRNYYGLGRKPQNLPQLADSKGVTAERIRQIKNKILEKLKTSLADRGINSIDDIL